MSAEKTSNIDSSPSSSILVPSNGTTTNHNPTPLPDNQDDEAIKEQLRNMSPEEFARREKALLWKLDKKLVPWMT
jgi:hypothetical protein